MVKKSDDNFSDANSPDGKINVKMTTGTNLMNYKHKTKAETANRNLNLQNYMKQQEKLEKNLVNLKIQPKRSKKDEMNKVETLQDQELSQEVDFYKNRKDAQENQYHDSYSDNSMPIYYEKP